MRHPALLLFAVLALGCSDKKSDDSPGAHPKPATGEGAEAGAGVVIEVTGKVTARRAGTKDYRSLEKDSVVHAEDTVTTAKEASVSIRLHHNGAVLALTGNKSRRLEATAAWKAPRGGTAGLLEGEATQGTAAAGRHAEREAADTRATAALTADDVEPPTPRRPKKHRDKRRPGSDGSDSKAPPPPPDEAQRLPEAAPDLPKRLGRGEIKAGINNVKAKVRACATKHPATGVVRVKFDVSPAGKVTRVTVVSSPDEDLGACVAGALKTATFPETKNGQTITYPFQFH